MVSETTFEVDAGDRRPITTVNPCEDKLKQYNERQSWNYVADSISAIYDHILESRAKRSRRSEDSKHEQLAREAKFNSKSD